MTKSINHRDFELFINHNCDDCDLKIAAYYSTNNKIVIASKNGVDKFFTAARERNSDLSQAVVLESRYLVIGEIKDIDEQIFDAFELQNSSDAWLEIPAIPDDLHLSRLLIAGAARILVVSMSRSIAQTPEYKQAVIDGRVTSIIC